MSQVNSSTIPWQHSVESALGVSSSTWKPIEPKPNTAKLKPNLKTVARSVSTADRQQRPGTIIGVDATFEYESDAVLDSFTDMVQDAVCSIYKGGAVLSPTAVTTSAFTVPSGGALAQNTLIVAKGFANAANNGLFVVGAASTGTSVTVTGTVAETTSTAQNATIEVCGWRGASADITLTVSGGVVTLGSTIADFTTMGITPGMGAWLGGAAANAFATAADRGGFRFKTVAAHACVLDRTPGTWATDAGTGKLIDIYFGRMVRPVSRLSADWLQRSHSFEGTYPSLGGIGTDKYRYGRGMTLDQMTIDIVAKGAVALKYMFKGTDGNVPTLSRDSGASTPLTVTQDVMIASATDVMRLRLMDMSEVEYSIDNAWFTKATITINNNVKPEEFIGSLAAGQISVGEFLATVQFTGLLTTDQVLIAARSQTAVGLDFLLRSADGAVYFDFPAGRLSVPDVDAPANELVKQSATYIASKELSTYPHAVAISILPYCPAS